MKEEWAQILTADNPGAKRFVLLHVTGMWQHFDQRLVQYVPPVQM